MSGSSGGTCQMQGECCLSYRGSGGYDHLVSRLPSGSHPVEVGKTGGYARHSVPVGCHTGFHLSYGVLHQLFHRPQVVSGTVFVFQPVQQAVCIHQCVGDVCGLVAGEREQFVAPQYHFPSDILLFQYFGMIFQVRA